MELPGTIYLPDEILEQPFGAMYRKDVNEEWVNFCKGRQRKRIAVIAKRVFDISFSSLVILIFLTWMIPIIAFLIKIDSGGPVFFFQKRVGRGGAGFLCFKFRTMSEEKSHGSDFIVTAIGKFLRQSNLDELPQFFNVLLGNMSVVGPRPHMYYDCQRFSRFIPNYENRNIIKPGITGLAQVKGYHGPVSDPVSILQRFYWDMIYIKKFSLALDLSIVFKTAWQRIIWILCYPFLR